ncbi:MAG: TonB-dependent receptor, partial [Bacteroidota bacterium]
DLTLYGTSKYFERTASNYRIIGRDGFGATARFVTRAELFGRPNEFTMGTDLFYQSGPVETYQNIGGKKGDRLDKLIDETIGNTGFYIQNTFNLIRGKLDLLLSGRYDKVLFDSRNLLAEVQNDARRFEDFTPKAALNFKLTPTIAAFTSYGLSFDSPAANELDNPKTTSSSTASLLNPDLKPQQSKNFELGVKGNVVTPEEGLPHSLFFEATFFNTIIDDEIVPFELAPGDVFFRNSARTRRTGLELGANIEIVKGLKLKASYTFSDFKYKEYITRTIVDSMGNEVVRDLDFSNNVVPSVPKHNLGLALSHEQELAEKVTGFIKLSYTNISGMYTDDGNSERTTGYQLVNATVGLDVVLDRFDLLISAGANNIANKTYVAFININSTNKQFYEAGEPRNYFVGINLGYAL